MRAPSASSVGYNDPTIKSLPEGGTGLSTMSMRSFLIVLIVLVTGCAGLAAQQRMEQLSQMTKSYERALKMSDYRKASHFCSASQQDKPTVNFEYYANIKIVRYKVTSHHVSADHLSAEQDVELQYYWLDQNILKTKIHHQVWHYDRQRKAWLLQTGLPDL